MFSNIQCIREIIVDYVCGPKIHWYRPYQKVLEEIETRIRADDNTQSYYTRTLVVKQIDGYAWYNDDQVSCIVSPTKILNNEFVTIFDRKLKSSIIKVIAKLVYDYLGWLHPYYELNDNFYGRLIISPVGSKQFAGATEPVIESSRLFKVPVFSPDNRDIKSYEYLNVSGLRRVYGHQIYN